jgi:thiol-disulfide isomerase/thioredoxin
MGIVLSLYFSTLNTNMRKLVLLLCLIFIFCFHSALVAQFKNGPKQDSEAPPFFVKGSLDNKYQPTSFQNKFVVLDFWATWCAPCIAGFPHFNSLADKFSKNKNQLIHLLSKIFNFRFSQQIKPVRGYKLIVTDTVKLHAFETMQTNHSSDSDPVNGSVEIVNYTMDKITILMEGYLKYPIKNETGSDKKYDLAINVKDVAEANKQLAEYGLLLTETSNELFEIVYIDFNPLRIL